MLTTSTRFFNKNQQQIKQVRMKGFSIAPKVESVIKRYKPPTPNMYCGHGIYSGVCTACGASE